MGGGKCNRKSLKEKEYRLLYFLSLDKVKHNK